MNIQDSRHGTNAGAVQHWRDGEQPCAPCRLASNRLNKLTRYDRDTGNPRTVTLGPRAHQVIVNVPADQLAKATGISVHKFARLRAAGPGKAVNRTTRQRIEKAGARHYWTPLGIHRRVCALAVIGWSSRALAAHAGIGYEAVKRAARTHDRAFVRAEVAAAIIGAYDELCMTPAPAGPSASRTSRAARRNGWAPPLAYDDIDHDPAPTGVYAPPTTATELNTERAAKRLADLEHAVEHGHTLARVCTDLGIGEDSLWRWCRRYDRGDLWAVFKRREEGGAHAA